MSCQTQLARTEWGCYIEQVRADWNSVGIAVAVVLESEVIYARGFGVRDFGRADCLDADTLFQVGSTSKAFTSAALGIMADEGKIHWDAPVIDYLPGFRLQDPWLTPNLTIRDILTHRSGISDPIYPFLGVVDSGESVRHLRYATSEAAFRDSYRYSNLMYALAGKVIESVSGMTWHDFVRRYLLQPLKMKRSGTSPYEFWDAQYVAPVIFGSPSAKRLSLSDARDGNVAMPHGRDEQGLPIVLPWRSYDNAAGAGAIVSSAADMANWLLLHLNEGRFEGQQLLKKRTLQELHATQNPHVDRNPSPFDLALETYAMGWRRAEHCGQTRLAHGGGMIGFPSYVALLPDRKIGIVVLSNGPMLMRDNTPEYLPHKAIAFWVFDRLLEGPRRDWSHEFLSQYQRVQQKARQREEEICHSRLPNGPPSLPLEQYCGAYEDPIRHSGLVHVHVINNRLTLSFAGEGAFCADLEHWHHDLFRLRPRPGMADVLGARFAVFTLDSFGKVASMSAFDTTFQYLPPDCLSIKR